MQSEKLRKLVLTSQRKEEIEINKNYGKNKIKQIKASMINS